MSRKKIYFDYVISIVFSLIKPVGVLWMIQLAEHSLTPIILGVFLFSRRLSNSAAALVQLGTSQTLMKFVAENNNNASEKRSYVIFALLLFLIIFFIGIVFTYFMGNSLDSVFYPNTKVPESFSLWTVILLFSYVINFISIATLIAERRIFTFNLFQLFSNSGFLIIYFLIEKDFDLLSLMKFQALTIFALSILTLFYFLYETRKASWPNTKKWASVKKDFLHYGAPRGFISFLDMTFFFIGPWLLRNDMTQAGYLIIALSVIKLTQALVLPVGQLSGIIISHYSVVKNNEYLQIFIQVLFGIMLIASILVMPFISSWVELFLGVWLGENSTGPAVSVYLSILIWGIVPYAIYQILYSIIDMHWEKPWNFYILSVGILSFIILFAVLNGIIGSNLAVSISFVSALWIMGVMSTLIVLPFLKNMQKIGLWRLALVTLLLFFINHFFSQKAGIYPFIFSALISFATISLYLILNKSPYFQFIFQTLGLKR